MTQSKRTTAVLVPWLIAAMLMVVIATRQPGQAGMAANKAGAASSKIEMAEENEDKIVLSKKIKTGGPQDLILAVTAECSIVTNVQTIANETDDQSASGHIETWVTINGKPVANGDGVERVVFCDRTYHRKITNFSDDDDETNDTIQTYFNTRSSHAFNWVALDVGSGIWQIDVHVKLSRGAEAKCTEAQVLGTEDGTCSLAVIGNRTLVIDPAHFGHGADTDTL
jgi:hypothetical protein